MNNFFYFRAYIFSLLAIWISPYFIFYEQNYEQIIFLDTLQPLVILCLICFCLFFTIFILSKLFPKKIKFFFILAIVSSLFGLNFEFIYEDQIKKQFENFINVKLVFFLFLFSTIFIIMQVTKISFFKHFLAFSLIFSCLIPCFNLLYKAYNNKNGEFLFNISEIQSTQTNSEILKENIYFILLDGYASKNTFLNLNSDNDFFYNYLHRKNFKMLGDKAAYNFSYLAISSLFYLNYPVIEGDTKYFNRSQFFPALLGADRVPPLIEELNELEYEFIFAGNSWSGCDPKYVKCISFFDGFFTFETSVIFSKTALAYFLRYKFNNDAIGNFMSNIDDRSVNKNPKFYFLYQLSPHPPYLDKDCKTEQFEGLENWKPISKYLTTVKCVNDKVIKLISLIEESDPTSIIVIQSDHGPITGSDWLKNNSNENIKNRMGIINAIKTPQECEPWLNENLGPINTVRFLLACIKQVEPLYIDEKTYIGMPEGEDGFGYVKRLIDK